MDRFLIVFLATLLLAATACHHTDKVDQLAALDSAYQSGLLTKDEYDAKRLALTGAAPAPVAKQAPAPLANPEPPAAPPTKEVPPPAPPSPALPPPTPPSPALPPSRAPSSPRPVPPSPSSVSPPSGADANESEPAPLAGCEDAEFKSGGQKGAEGRFFAAPPDAVRRAAISALDSLDFNIHKTSNKEIEASKKRHIGAIVGAGGERVILSLQKSESGGRSGTLVIGKTKKSFVGRVTQKTWTDAVLAQIACKLRESSR
jgi:hypothetical protein